MTYIRQLDQSRARPGRDDLASALNRSIPVRGIVKNQSRCSESGCHLGNGQHVRSISLAKDSSQGLRLGRGEAFFLNEAFQEREDKGQRSQEHCATNAQPLVHRDRRCDRSERMCDQPVHPAHPVPDLTSSSGKSRAARQCSARSPMCRPIKGNNLATGSHQSLDEGEILDSLPTPAMEKHDSRTSRAPAIIHNFLFRIFDAGGYDQAIHNCECRDLLFAAQIARWQWRPEKFVDQPFRGRPGGRVHYYSIGRHDWFHCSFELGMLFLNSEVGRVQGIDPGVLLFSEFGTLGSCSKFEKLVFVVDVRQG